MEDDLDLGQRRQAVAAGEPRPAEGAVGTRRPPVDLVSDHEDRQHQERANQRILATLETLGIAPDEPSVEQEDSNEA